MVLKGRISTVDNYSRKARVVFEDRDNGITPEITIARDIGSLNINDMVAVVVFSDNMTDGLIISRF